MRNVVSLAVWLCLAVTFVSCKKGVDRPDDVIDPALQPETEQPSLTGVSFTINDQIKGYYISQPFNYDKSFKRYPLLIFIPGAGQYGNGTTDLPLLLNDGVAKLVKDKKFPVNIVSNKENFSFITITPQFTNFPTLQSVTDMLNYARKNFKIDTTRIYIAGLSVGGTMACTFAATYPNQIAALAPMAGEDINYNVCQSLAQNRMPVWAFHNSNDPSSDISNAQAFMTRINSYSPSVSPRLTVFQSFSHDSWSAALNPDYRENNMNVYEWMLQYRRN